MDNTQTRYHFIGDSHVSIFGGKDYMQPTWPNHHDEDSPKMNVRTKYNDSIEHYRLGPLTAFNFEKNASEWVQKILTDCVDKENDWVFFNLGEIDCSGHLPGQAEKTSINRAVETCIRKYVTYVSSIKAQGYNVGVVGPHIAAWYLEDETVLSITKRFNQLLKMAGFKYITVFDYLCENHDGENYFDGYHLSQKILPLYLKQLPK